MKTLFVCLNSCFSRLSNKGKRLLKLYCASLILISGLDGIAIYIIAALSPTSGSYVTAINRLTTATAMTVIVALFISKSLLSVYISYKAMNTFSREEVLIGQQNSKSIDILPWISRKNFLGTDYFAMVDRGPSALVQGVLVPFAGLIAEIISMLVLLGVVFIVQPVTALSAALFFGISALIQHNLLSKLAKKAGSEINSRTIETYDLLNDKVNLSKVLQIMPSKSLQHVLANSRSHLALSRARINFIASLPRYVMESVLAIGFVVISLFNFYLLGSDYVLPGLVLFAAVSFRLLPSINRIQGLILQVLSAIPVAEETFRVAHTQTKNEENQTMLKLSGDLEQESGFSDSRTLIKLEHVTFRYPESEESVVTDVSITLESGKQYAIVGPSGSGKTTLIEIILGLLKPDQGKVLRNSSMKDALTVAYVPQETKEAAVDFLGNVAMEWEKGSIDQERAFIALQKAKLDEVYLVKDSEKSEQSEFMATLSGGQTQRLGLARAFYRNPHLIVFDESTSSLDMLTEKLVMDHINTLRGNCTTVIVAHRLSTIQKADEIIYVKNGRILGQGNFKNLQLLVSEFRDQVTLGKME